MSKHLGFLREPLWCWICRDDQVSPFLSVADHLIGMLNAINLHSRRARRHPGNRDTNQIIALAEFEDLSSRYMTFDELAVNHRRVARRQPWHDAQALLHCCHVAFNVVDDFEAIRFEVRDPLLATPTIGITMDINRQGISCLKRRCGG